MRKDAMIHMIENYCERTCYSKYDMKINPYKGKLEKQPKWVLQSILDTIEKIEREEEVIKE